MAASDANSIKRVIDVSNDGAQRRSISIAWLVTRNMAAIKETIAAAKKA